MKISESGVYQTLIIGLLLCCSTNLYATPGHISTIAGGGAGDGLAATQASFYYPMDVFVDRKNNVYVADAFNHRIRKITPDGIITTVAGTGELGETGDGGMATDALLNLPARVSLDNFGNMYIADKGNQRVRSINPRGYISTAIQLPGSNRLSIPGPGSPFTVHSEQFRAGLLDTYGGIANSSLAIQLTFSFLVDAYVNPFGALYVTEYGGNREEIVFENLPSTIKQESGQQTPVEGRGVFADAKIRGKHLIIDEAGVMYYVKVAGLYTDIYNPLKEQVIHKLDLFKQLETIAGRPPAQKTSDGGPSLIAEVNPTALALNTSQRLYIGESTHRIRYIDEQNQIWTVAGTGQSGFSGDGGSATAAQISVPNGLSFDTLGNLYFADTFNHRIRTISPDGIISTFAGGGVGDHNPATEASLNRPGAICIDQSGAIYIADTENHRIRKISTSGQITTIAGTGKAGYSGDNDLATLAQLNSPSSIAIDEKYNLYIADHQNHRIRKITPTGHIKTIAGNGRAEFSGDGGPADKAGLSIPIGVAVGPNQTLYIADLNNHRIRKIDATNTIHTIAGSGQTPSFSGDGGPASQARLSFPSSVFADAQGNVYLADRGNQRIRKIDTQNTIHTIAGTGQKGFSQNETVALNAHLENPNGITADRDGNVYISETNNHVVRKIDTDGNISFVSGLGKYGGRTVDFQGNTLSETRVSPSAFNDNGPSVQGKLHYPRGIALDLQGNLYIADTGHNRIRMIQSVTTGLPQIDIAASDFDNNGQVGFPDFLLFAQAFGSTNSTFDLDENGTVDFTDFLVFATAFAQSNN